jgi:AraC-like DNA-binding protein
VHTFSPRVANAFAAAEPPAGGACGGGVVIRAVRRGTEWVGPKRSLRLDADVYLVADAASAHASAREPGSEPIAIELSAPADAAAGAFLPALRPVLGPIGARLAEVAARRPHEQRICLAGSEADAWWSALAAEEGALRARAARICCVRPGTRELLFRRLLRAADFIQSHYEQPLNVELLAAVANLSPFHFARLFALVMDETPHAFLLRKRLAVARRLLACGVGRSDAAERAGFGCRSTLFRHLRPALAA